MHYLFFATGGRTTGAHQADDLASMKLSTVTHTSHARVPTSVGEFQLYHYIDQRDAKEHLALVMGDVHQGENVLVRVHSECFTGDVLGSLRCDCGEQLQRAMQMIATAGCGVIVYLRQEGRGIGLAKKLAAYNLQDQGYDTVEANLLLGHQADEREYSSAAAILHELAVASVRLLTNNPAKIEHLRALGIQINERVPLEAPFTPHNRAYLATKVQRMRHLLTLPATNGHRAALTQAPPTAAVQAQLQQLQGKRLAHQHRTKRPFVTLSYAQSLDGCLAAQPGQRLHLSSPAALTVTHALRASHDAILVGIGTVLSDDPKLTARLVDGPQPQPVVLDSRLRLPLQAQVLAHPKAVWLATAAQAAHTEKACELQRRGAAMLPLALDQTGQIQLAPLLDKLGEMGIRSVMVEGGAQVLTSFLTQQLVDYAVVTLAPRFVGGLAVIAQANQHVATESLPQLANLAHTPVGPDLLLWGEPTWEKALDD